MTTDWQQTIAQALSSTSDADSLLATAADAARSLGYEFFAYGIRMPLPLSRPQTLMISNYPKQWQQRYAEQSYMQVDPTVAHALRSTAPLQWSEDLFASAHHFWEDAQGHGLHAGWAQATVSPNGAIGMLTLARSSDAISEQELEAKGLQMHWLVSAVHEHGARVFAPQLPQLPQLTERECDVLRWTADGKTSSEIGDILGVSERTVNFHINNCMDKLGAVNKTACTIKAAMLRLI
ncbi:autoinducer binding domain-containing protein [Pseudoduganella violaceinigra]|uniref:autoinducer binding domain-containing protein n=1 Tax=Pseudoduganella violaceinigra TaxID=246602 RepID=UPI0009FFA489|nr:autoinducer binding domain-containing protein [Pseudoduganella violaceinigra]